MKTKEFLGALDDEAIAKAIGEAEKRTSGEIRVFVTHEPVVDVVKEAERQFIRLGMARTRLRNGVLIYFAPASQSFAVLGDKAVHEKCGEVFWRTVTEKMNPVLKEKRFTEAIVLGVHEIGELLAREFPWEHGDRNELPNTVERDHNEHG